MTNMVNVSVFGMCSKRYVETRMLRCKWFIGVYSVTGRLQYITRVLQVERSTKAHCVCVCECVCVCTVCTAPYRIKHLLQKIA